MRIPPAPQFTDSITNQFNMEKRNITVDLLTAKKWFQGEDATLKELALQAFTESELTTGWKSITTFKDAIIACGLCEDGVESILTEFKSTRFEKMLAAQYKLGIIKKALNEDWTPSLNGGETYYPYFRWYPKGTSYPDGWTVLGNFKDLYNNKTYTLLGGGGYDYYDCGLGLFRLGYGGISAYVGLLSCKSKEIALHLGKYFGKIVFDAIFGQYDNYKWTD